MFGMFRTYADGEMIFSETDAAADMYLIVKGGVRIFRQVDEHEIDFARLGPGDTFGEMALFGPWTRCASASAIGELQVEVIDRPTFMLLVGDPLAWRILSGMSARLRLADEAVETLARVRTRT